MFFNKLKQEMRKEFSEKMTIIFAKLSEDVIDGILAANKSTEELIKKYEHTQWKNLEPFERNVLVDRFNLQELYDGLGIYCGDKTTFFDNSYVGETIKTAYEKELKEWEEKYIPKRRLEKELQEEKKYIPIPPVTDKDRLNIISAIIKHQKSTDKAIQEIKEVLKEIE